MKYNGRMDKECIKLCDALNEIKGVETSESCCGHGVRPFSVWLKCDNSKQLFPLIRQISRNYANNDWHCEVALTDMENRPIIFHLYSFNIGNEAYREADKIADRILEFLKWDEVMEMFHIER